MPIEPISTENACKIDEKDQCQMLKEHFLLMYKIIADYRLTPDATFEKVKGHIQRCLSGVPFAFNNAVFGSPKDIDWDACIKDQIRYFNEAKMPWVWCLDENVSNEFKQKLMEHGFKDDGVFRGVIGSLDKPIPTPVVPEDCTIQLVEEEAAMDEFNDLVCTIFSMNDQCKDAYRKILWEATKNPEHPMFHWIARKNGKAISAVSTLIENEMVSFWNGASLPEIRHQGISTALRQLALKHAISKGCRFGSSYLMSEGLAFGICSKLGYQTKWRFNVFTAPDANKESL